MNKVSVEKPTNSDSEAVDRLINFFSLLIEIDQHNKRKNKQKK